MCILACSSPLVTEVGGDFNDVASLGEDTFVNSDTGKLSLRLDNLGRHTVVLQAESGEQSGELINWTMHVREGPNGRPCGDHGGPADDGSNTCSCVCTSDHSGRNCEDPPAPASGTSDTAVMRCSLGGALSFVAAAVVGARTQTCRVKHRPVDVASMQCEVLGTLGTKLFPDLADDEFGVELVFRATLDVAEDSNRGTRSTPLLDRFPDLADDEFGVELVFRATLDVAEDSNRGTWSTPLLDRFQGQLLVSIAKCVPWLGNGVLQQARIVLADLGLPQLLRCSRSQRRARAAPTTTTLPSGW